MKWALLRQAFRGREGITNPPRSKKVDDIVNTDMHTQEERDGEEFQVQLDNRRQQAQRDFELAGERLAESRAELEKLRAEYRAMPDKIGLAEWQFNQALRALNEAKSVVAVVFSTP